MKVSHAVIILLLVIILGVVAYALFENGRNSPTKVVYHNNVVRRRPYEWGVKMHPLFSASPTYIVHHNHKNVPHAPAPAPAPEPESAPETEPEAPPSEEPFKVGMELFKNKKENKKHEGMKVGLELFKNMGKRLRENMKMGIEV